MVYVAWVVFAEYPRFWGVVAVFLRKKMSMQKNKIMERAGTVKAFKSKEPSGGGNDDEATCETWYHCSLCSLQ
jgi:hypothetical protein